MITSSALLNLKDMRAELNLSQSELAAMAGISKRAVQSYEQGWRKPPHTVERILLLMLIASRNGNNLATYCCWQHKECSPEVRSKCIAYVTRQGHLCWFLTGTMCEGQRQNTWADKLRLCINCSFMQRLLSPHAAENGLINASRSDFTCKE